MATTSVEAAKILREHASLKINRDVARKKAVNPYLAHRQTSFSTSSSSSSFFFMCAILVTRFSLCCTVRNGAYP